MVQGNRRSGSFKVTLIIGKHSETLKGVKRKMIPSEAVSTALYFGFVPLACTECCFLSGSRSKICDGDPCLACVVRILAQLFGR